MIGLKGKIFLFMLFGLGHCLTAHAGDRSCLAQNSSMEAAQCASEKLKSAEEQLDSSFQEALGKLPDINEWDVRKTKGQLKKAQNAWLIYRNENCQYVGGLQGGSNIWVSVFSTECAIEETKKRIVFFKNLPTDG